MSTDNADYHPYIIEPRPSDVLIGRGGLTLNHPGNVKFRRLVLDRKLTYKTAKRQVKHLVADEIVDKIQNGGGRFIKRRRDGWYEVLDKIAKCKAMHALRDKKEPRYRPEWCGIDSEDEEGMESGGTDGEDSQKALKLGRSPFYNCLAEDADGDGALYQTRLRHESTERNDLGYQRMEPAQNGGHRYVGAHAKMSENAKKRLVHGEGGNPPAMTSQERGGHSDPFAPWVSRSWPREEVNASASLPATRDPKANCSPLDVLAEQATREKVALESHSMKGSAQKSAA